MKSMARTPSVWVLMVAMPLIFSLIFGGMAGSSEKNKPVVLYSAGSDALSTEAAKLLTGNKQYKWEKVSAKKAREAVNGQKAIAAVLIGEGMAERIEKQEPLFTIAIQRETQEYLALYPHIEGAARTIASSYEIAAAPELDGFAALIREVSGKQGIRVDKEIIQREGNKGEAVSLSSIGFTIMFMMFGISGAAATILEERAGGTWARLMASPVSRTQIICGYILSYFLLGWLQLGILAISIKVLFNGQWGSPLYFIPFASIVILTVVGLGLMIAGLVKTKQQAGALSAVIIVSTSMLGGVYWPLDVVPDFMKLIAKFVPQSWMMEGIREIVSGSLHTKTILTATAMLIGFCLLFFYLGLRKLKYEN
ncbi:ABC transporter permease [Neobacillus piezotolerans]|uniref:ABC transporter permease n=2 Tax=Neobacillus piezotolerans TaxID=2259171 RepID=A0A3D8GWX2_9BACI|nr:ABC transporter permease [Neobacillus piezotolerans]